ncbi:hypothetical protein FDC22_05955 [Clostridium botulinum]|uniref:Membrane associated protein n=1 Tax=Clostridium botulinum (strain Okra / Type B1) TaxID=498213 RepID=B1IIZ8_CLOBK|nr:hypothetical protein [Clostridium botulinum]EKX81046.1 membrane associated protein [Clostridium botulinum CFSAN001628]ACA44347.1 membrane associated protein [Clostridium botulinum B1 str. Okra]MBD5563522.1 hypothetical protein [Clostridium botulinum]MBD5566924.1 hypothetical protein [Clostridium botulinum]MBD5570463.1 hypothetical protein [Clostridium botulinum]
MNEKIDIEKAKKVLESIKDEDLEIKYIGIEKVIYDETKKPYKTFPVELKNKKVYMFDAFIGKDEDRATRYQYYVDFDGNVYRDDYPINATCIKIK